MKYLIVLGDGMADEPIEALDGKTPLEYAQTPMMDELSQVSEIGLAKTIPAGLKPGSDVANLAVIGYNPEVYYSGRSPLEALSIGVDMKDTDIAMRVNLVTVSDDDKDYANKIMIDHSAGEISTDEAEILLDAVRKELETDEYKFYLGTSYRHLCIWDKGEVLEFAQPHDILGQEIASHLSDSDIFVNMMKKSYEILNSHPINIERAKKGLNKANSIWFWGAGVKPKLDSFEEKTKLKGVMISAVDLLKGIAVGAGMTNIDVEGADGTLETNYEGKAFAAIKALTEDDYDFAYIHVEAPDEMGHQGSVERKVKAIENLDQRVIKPLVEELGKHGVEYRMLIMPDHPTPIRLRTHTSEPVPYMIYDNVHKVLSGLKYTEKDAKESGNFIENGYTTIERLIG
ncbi:MAG: cofactor-independent phosphoglycerate mutase [Lachnospiraceae bacterium]|nr:cofactor-independent phosphoglycerate mutase [Lachnospiraceae bacterium]